MIVAGTSPVDAVLPLRDQWRAANLALAQGEPMTAYRLFEEFDTWYSQEPDVQETPFKEKWVRLWGLSALQAGHTEKGIELLETWLSENVVETPFRAFIRFQTGNAYRSMNQHHAATRHWSAFILEHADLPECALVHWLWAEMLLEEADIAGALFHLEKVLEESRLPRSGRILAKAALAMAHLSEGRQVEAFDHLANAGDKHRMLTLWRACMAPWLTTRLLAEEQFDQALASCRWFDTPVRIRDQVRQLTPNANIHRGDVRRTLWQSHWLNQVGRLASAVDGADTIGSDLPALYRLKLRALLKSGHADEALLLSQALLESHSQYALSLRADAYAAAIEACHLLENWTTANSMAEAFIEEYPDDESLPRILFLHAKTAAGQKSYQLAQEIIHQLLGLHPDHPSRPSWEVAAASWLLDEGQYTTALQQFRELVNSCPQSWRSFLQFQEARCLANSGEPEQATRMYHEVTVEGHPALAEQAYIAILKIHLGTGQAKDFMPVLADYHRDHPQGRCRQMAALLEASMNELLERTDRAVMIYEGISREHGPFANQAHQQLSRIHRAMSDLDKLREHAFLWISQAIETQTLPERALEDCLHYQLKRGKPALPGELCASIYDSFSQGMIDLPAIPFLNLLEDQWAGLRQHLPEDTSRFKDWIKGQLKEFQTSGQWEAFAGCSLYLAGQREKEGRHDSADTIRISLLNNVPLENMSGEILFIVSQTAAKYDFPQCGHLLTTFIKGHEDSHHLPTAMFLLAGILRSSGQLAEAKRLLREIQSGWPDASIYNEAMLLLAEWQTSDESGLAESTLAALLERDNLPPSGVAKALLLRARLGLKTGKLDRCELDCRRILILYPAFREITEEAELILSNLPNA